MAQIKYNYTATDFRSDQEVKWCPGCGDHAILNSVAKAMAEFGAEQNIPHERFTVVSGIGCSSRFPYYVNIYGFHSIHGRAAAIATGVKVANPQLSVWQVSGDGDALAIGGNHFIHAIRRNIDINILLFNNEIYGLTKGQYSPTSRLGMVTKTSPYGTVEEPFNPGELVLGTRGTFFARAIDIDMALSQECMIAGARHKGTSVVELLQNCVIFNDKTFGNFALTKEMRQERTISLRHGERMIFGANRDKGLILDGLKLKVATIGQDGVTENDILVHDTKAADPVIHHMLAKMRYPDFPVALGVIRDVDKPTYDAGVEEQIENLQKTAKIRTMDDLLQSGQTWEVK